ncbi:MAG: nucleotidyl transferase AbiEii/AbiGii toxin family protein [Actinobacteria bacterium]|nr:nucleotidyl transferase AbiEii/AbiGii toxin family protein [Actinomycetota bacterium]
MRCYSIAELFGEKLRALAERCRPRDLYDVVHMYRHPDLVGVAGAVREVLTAKCAFAGIEVPTVASIHSSPYRAEIEREWENMLGHQLPRPLVPFGAFWSALDDAFAWLEGTLARVVLPRAEFGSLEPWTAPPRRVEPYSLRRTRDGNLVLFVINDYGQLRSYRVDHIAGIKVSSEAFSPRYRVEF